MRRPVAAVEDVEVPGSSSEDLARAEGEEGVGEVEDAVRFEEGEEEVRREG